MGTKLIGLCKKYIKNITITEIIIMVLIMFFAYINISEFKRNLNSITTEYHVDSSVIKKNLISFTEKSYLDKMKNLEKSLYDDLYINSEKKIVQYIEEMNAESDEKKKIADFTQKLFFKCKELCEVILIDEENNKLYTNEPEFIRESYDQIDESKQNSVIESEDFIFKYDKINKYRFNNLLSGIEKIKLVEKDITVNSKEYKLIIFNTNDKFSVSDYMLIYLREISVEIIIQITILLLLLFKLILNIKTHRKNLLKESINNDIFVGFNRKISIKTKFYGNVLLLLTCMLSLFVDVAMQLNLFPLWGFLIGIFITNIYRYFTLLRLLKNIKNKELSNENCNFKYGMNDIYSEIYKIDEKYRLITEENLKSEKLKTELITNVSHDLKTPLTSIINYIDFLKNKELTEEERGDYLSILDRKANRLNTLITDLFEVSKLSSGKIELKKEEVDIVQLIHQSLGECAASYDEKDIEIKFNTEEESVFKNLDGQKFSRVFENIINNAYKYSKDGTRAYLDLKKNENDIVISLKNISEYELNFDGRELFERFARGDLARNSKIEGSGLGLSIAKSIVELHGGEMDINIEGDMFKVFVKI